MLTGIETGSIQIGIGETLKMGRDDSLTHAWKPQRFDQLIEQFEEEFRSNPHARIEPFVGQVQPAERDRLAKQLLMIAIKVYRELDRPCDPQLLCQMCPDQSEFIERQFSDASAVSSPWDDLIDTEMPVIPSTRYFCEPTPFAGGGQGILFTATDEELGGRDVVIKFLKLDHDMDPRVRNQFEREAEVTAKLDHPGIVPVYSHGTLDDEGRPFYAMRLIHGRPFDNKIRNYHSGGRKRAELIELVEHLIAACNTIAYAHDVGILHCDLKPKNIMTGRFGATLVVDWGLAREFPQQAESPQPDLIDEWHKPIHIRKSATSSGFTIPYASPEQLSNDSDRMSPASDVYSLGATLYEVLTGRPPFDVRDDNVRQQVVQNQYVKPRAINPHVPKRLEAICVKAMSGDPQQRYATAMALARDLQNWLRDEEVSAAPDHVIDRVFRVARRHKTATALTLLSLAILAIAGFAIRTYQLKTQDLSNSFDSALQVIETFSHPLANDETEKVEQFVPLADDMLRFADDYLLEYQDRASALRLARINEIRGAIAFFNFNIQSESAFRTSALNFYQKAAEHYDSSLREHQIPIARNLVTQGRLLKQIAAESTSTDKPELQLAIEDLIRAIEILAQVPEPAPFEAKRIRAEAFHLLGESYVQRATTDMYEKSKSQYYHSIELRQKLVSQLGSDAAIQLNPDQVLAVRDLARGYGYVGDVEVLLDEMTGAKESYDESLAHRQRLHESDPTNAEHAFQYARGLTNFGRMALVAGCSLVEYRDTIQQRMARARELQHNLAIVGDQRFIRDYAGTLNLLVELDLLDIIRLPDDSPELLLDEVIQQLEAVDHQNRKSTLATCHMLRSVLLHVDGDVVRDGRVDREAQLAVRLLTNDGDINWRNLDRRPLLTYAIAQCVRGKTDAAKSALIQSIENGNNQYMRIKQHLTRGGLQSLADDQEVQVALASIKPQSD